MPLSRATPLAPTLQIRRRSFIGFLIAALLCVVPVARAQVSTALVHGNVVDETKAVLPGTMITAINEETGLTRTTTTDERGYYRISALPPGRYRVSAELTGFA